MSRPWLLQTSRLLIGVIGGYVVSASVVGVLSILLVRTSALSASDAAILASMSGFLIYLALILVSFVRLPLHQFSTIMAAVGGTAWGFLQLLRPN